MRRWLRRLSRPRLRIEVVGDSAGALAEALTAGGLEARAVAASDADPDADAVVVVDGAVAARSLPRRALRLGWVEDGAEATWDVDLVEDVDAVLVADAAASSALRPVAVGEPRLRGHDPARDVSDAVAEQRARPSVAIVTGVSKLHMRQRWGDHHFGIATAKALRRAGVNARVLCQGELDRHDLTGHDAVLLLAGKVDLASVPGVPTLAWVISHPDRVHAGDLDGLAAAFVASERFAARLRADGAEVEALHQCTDPQRFAPTPGGPAHELLFVGNSRGVRRRMLGDLPEGHDLAVYGYGWDADLLDPRHLRGDHVPNGMLPAYYSGAAIVLNDHWDSMRELAFPSNRLYDASACAATVVSDHVEGLEELFDGAITTYRDRAELRDVLDALLADPGRRRELGEAGRAAVLERHTFDHRVGRLLEALPRR